MKQISALRNILAQPFIRILPVGATALAVSGLLFAAPQPASAQANFHVCETSGSYCLGAPNLVLYDPVVETTGRLINETASGTGDNVKLEFADNETMCVAASDSGNHVVIHPCNGSGVVWIPTDINGNNGSELLENSLNPGKYLSGQDNGGQFQLENKGQKGWYQRFSER